MRMSFLELLEILKQHWDLGKIELFVLELIFTKYFSVSWKLTGNSLQREESRDPHY